jgi:hypothetical protein
LNYGQVDFKTPNWCADIALKDSRLKRFKMALAMSRKMGEPGPQRWKYGQVF